MVPHAGTIDLDMGLAVGVLELDCYEELAQRLRSLGFEPMVNDQGNRRLQTWVAEFPDHASVDFLIPFVDDVHQGGTLMHIERDLAAIVTPGLELAFKDRVWEELSGEVHSGARGQDNSGMRSGRVYRVKVPRLREQAGKQGRL